ncbi:MAG: hypothetical protein M0R06_03905, partial [Sphaerochaeta sp.]|nr:hypothetical protein [Sphaerochaeta sp.]
VGNYAAVGYNATVGDNAAVGYNATVGDNATVEKFTPISVIGILVNVGIDISSGEATFYKAVKPDLTDFYTGLYQYRVGKSGEIKGLKVDQSVECGPGFHFTNLWSARAFAGDKPYVLISATIKLKDILSVHAKVRCRKFFNVKIVTIEGLK